MMQRPEPTTEERKSNPRTNQFLHHDWLTDNGSPARQSYLFFISGPPQSPASGKIHFNRPWHHKFAFVEDVGGVSLSPVDWYLVAGTRVWGWGRSFILIFFFV